MPRKGKIETRQTISDPVFASKHVGKLINMVMMSGKKTIARKHIYDALESIGKKTKKDPMEVFNQALDNIRPELEVRSRRIGGAAYQVPMPVRSKRKDSLSLRWLVEESRKRQNSSFRTFSEKIAAEIMDAAKGEGGAVSKRREMEKAAEANKAFAHLRW